ncbi:site-specific DNA-methyltransferase [Mucilaginibacter puniceus]
MSKYNKFSKKNKYTLLNDDVITSLDKLPNDHFSLIITSPPYNIGKEYEKDKKRSLKEYMEWLEGVIDKLCDKLKEDGSLCWQVGNYIEDNEVFPLDIFFYEIFKKKGLKLRNRIIWHFNFGLHSQKKFSGRYETLLWFTKSDDYKFNLDPIRIPQLYPGKRHSKKKGERAGKLSGNPNGKNPTDFWEFSADDMFKSSSVWEIPNVKANHPEKTIHPCQFPIELVERCVLAFTNIGDTILDPFVGTGTSVIAGIKNDRLAVGIDKDKSYSQIAISRIETYFSGELKIRPMGKLVTKPNTKDKVASIPEEWKTLKSTGS